MEQITLYYRQGSSDKVYQTAIENKNGGYVVNFQYGRRGTTLQSGTKTQSPVDYGAAKAIYDKLIKEKMGKGYTPGEEGSPYQHTDKAVSGISCQLLNPIEESEVLGFINNSDYAMQEKFDGRRMLLRKEGAAIEGINRKGLITGIPSILVNEVRSISGDFIMDGECVGEQFMAFDMLLVDGKDIRNWMFRDRCVALMNLLASSLPKYIRFVETAFDKQSKVAMLERLKKEEKEGVVFKRITAPYVAGRPSTGGDQLKHKFYETASFIVAKLNDKRSVTLKLLNEKRFILAGNVTIPPNHKVPDIGMVVEIRYLYAFKESGSVYQPVYLGERDDIDPATCTVAQLKFKPSC